VVVGQATAGWRTGTLNEAPTRMLVRQSSRSAFSNLNLPSKLTDQLAGRNSRALTAWVESHVAVGDFHELLHARRPLTPQPRASLAPETILGMIVDYADRLHPGINDGWSNKLEAAPLQLF
jgi:hypothetical protein